MLIPDHRAHKFSNKRKEGNQQQKEQLNLINQLKLQCNKMIKKRKEQLEQKERKKQQHQQHNNNKYKVNNK